MTEYMLVEEEMKLFIFYIIIILATLLLDTQLCMASESGNIIGYVYDGESVDPIVGARVSVVGTGLTILTDSTGQYKFDSLAQGSYSLKAAAKGYKTEIRKIEIQSTEAFAIDFQLKIDVFEVGEIVVTGKKSIVSAPSKAVVTGTEIRRIPGTGGDALRAIQTMPGISAMNDFSGQLSIRGGAPEDNSFFFDRIPLFAPYHFMGFSSTLNCRIINKVDVYAGGFDAKFGESQAVIDITSRDTKNKKISSTMDINMLMAEGLLEGRINNDTSWYVAGRRSYIDFFPIKSDEIIALPKFWDYQSKFAYQLSESNTLSFSVFGAEDFMKLKLKEEDVTNDPDLAGLFHWRSGYHSQGLSLETELPSGFSSFLTFSHNRMIWDISMGKGYYLRAKPHLYNLRGDASLPLNEKFSVETGFNAGHSDYTMQAFFIRPAEEEGSGDANFTDSPKVEVDMDEESNYGNGYAQIKYTPVEPISLTLGGRGDYDDATEEFIIVPRASALFRLPNNADLKLACGEYSQAPDGMQSSIEWGNPDLTSIKSYHYVIELERKFSPRNMGKISLYYKDFDNLVTSDPEKIFLNQGDGYAEGLEVFLRHEDPKRFFGWLSYAYSISKRQDTPDSPWRIYSYDQTHVLTAVASYKITPTLEIGGKWRYATGTPYTPVTGAEEIVDPETGNIRWKPIYGEKNSERLAPYHRLDIRLSKMFKFKGIDMTAYLEILNLYNRKNMLALDYGDDYTKEEKVHMLPIIPYFGITASF